MAALNFLPRAPGRCFVRWKLLAEFFGEERRGFSQHVAFLFDPFEFAFEPSQFIIPIRT